MSLRKYDVLRDNFEWDEADAFSFPCCVCEHKRTRDTEEPCRTCDHNANAVKDNTAGRDLLDKEKHD